MWLSMLKASSEISFLPVCSSQYMDLVLLSFDLTSKLSTWKLSSLILGEAFCLLLLPGVLRLSGHSSARFQPGPCVCIIWEKIFCPLHDQAEDQSF